MKNWPNQFPAVGAPDYSHSELFILSASTADSWWVYWHCPGEISLCQAWCIHSVLQLCEGLHRLCLPARIQKLKGIWRWELKRMTFHGNVLLLSPLAWWKVCPRCPEIDFLLLFFSFFLQKKEPIMQWGIACNVVQLRCLSLLQIVWQRASLHGYKTKRWTTQHFFFLPLWKTYQKLLNGASMTGWRNLSRTSKNQVLQSARGNTGTAFYNSLSWARARVSRVRGRL